MRMKISILLAPLISLAIVPPVPAHELDRFMGPWENTRRGQIELYRISITSREDGNVEVHAWGRCQSAETCSWGGSEVRIYHADGSTSASDQSADALIARFQVPGGEKLLIIRPSMKHLTIETFTWLGGDEGSRSYHSVETFGRPRDTAKELPPPPVTGSGDTRPEGIPPFPWPPPAASASMVIPSDILVKSGAEPAFLRDIDQRLGAALAAGGYAEKKYFAVPDGFAVVTRLEQINADGTPKEGNERWAPEIGPLRNFSLSEYIASLFRAPVGYYRIIVFIVTPHPFSEANHSVSRDEAADWLRSGLNVLPDSIAQRRYDQGFACTALVYEFQQPGGSGMQTVIMHPSNISASSHLEQSGIWDAFGR